MASATLPAAPARLKPSQAILFGTLTVGILDIADVFIFFGIRNGVRPARILQAIAAGLIGREAAIGGGLATAALGAVLHFFIAFLIVSIYYLASTRVRALTRRPLLSGALYGILAYVVMNFVVIPASAAGNWPPMVAPTPVLINGLLIHIFGVGIPSALFARVARGSSA